MKLLKVFVCLFGCLFEFCFLFIYFFLFCFVLFCMCVCMPPGNQKNVSDPSSTDIIGIYVLPNGLKEHVLFFFSFLFLFLFFFFFFFSETGFLCIALAVLELTL